MKLVLLGANGRTGRLVLEIALEKGIDVTAVVRSAGKAPNLSHERLKVVVGDPCDPSFLKTVFHRHDVVVSTLGGRRPTRAATSVYPRSADAIVEAGWESGLRRVLVTSTALLFPDQTFVGQMLRSIVPHIVRSATKMEATLASSGLEWTSVRPGFLTDADTARYCATRDKAPEGGMSVSRRAVAQFIVESLSAPDTYQAAFGISNSEQSAARQSTGGNHVSEE